MRRTAFLIPAILALALMIAAPAGAKHPWTPYEKGAFAAAQRAGKTIFVAVHADW
ncbi:MAG: hypothetical protein O2807_14180 [bacterium]|nr:hypothetical protein [bacterium]